MERPIGIHAKGDRVPALCAGFFDDRQEYMLRNPGWDHSAGMIPDKRAGSGSLKSHKSESKKGTDKKTGEQEEQEEREKSRFKRVEEG